MANSSDIWQQLKDHEILPPAEIFTRVQDAISDADQQLPAPGKGTIDVIMERLKEHESTPPPFLRAAVEERTKTPAPGPAIFLPAFRRRLFLRYIPAAACFLLLLSGWLIYKMSSPKTPHAAAKDGTVAKTAASGPVNAVPPADTLAAAPTKDTSLLAGPSKQRSGSSFIIDEQRVPVADNDLLLYFTSFSADKVPAYMTIGKDNDLAVKADRYTNIHISKNMLGMMKEIYLTKSNGKPTRKARKTKEKLDNWRTKDQQHFDSASGANSLDPIDLAEFIFK